MLTTNLRTTLEKLEKKRAALSLMPADRFQRKLHESITDACVESWKQTMKAEREDVAREVAAHIVRSMLQDDQYGGHALVKAYEGQIALLDEYTEARQHEVQADWMEKWRFLLFRLLLAVGIAAVVLITGAIAKHWEIPLPLLRMPGGL